MRVEQPKPEEDLFSVFENHAELYAYLYTAHGAEPLRAVVLGRGKYFDDACKALAANGTPLVMPPPETDPWSIKFHADLNREAANTLEAMGLHEAAAIVRESLRTDGNVTISGSTVT